MTVQSELILNMKKLNNMKVLEELYSEGKQIQTSFDLILQMLSCIPDDTLKNPNSTYLDPCCGSGKFLSTLARILDNKLVDIIPDKTERMKHIFEKQLFGTEIDSLQYIICKTNFAWETKYYGVNLENINYNIDNNDFFNSKWTNNMKFDVIIGNPPYNETSLAKVKISKDGDTVQKSKDSSNPLWLRFVKTGFELLKDENSIIAYVTPNLWLRPSNNHATTKKLREEGHFKYAQINSDEIKNKYFSGVGSTFTYWVWQNKLGTHNIFNGQTHLKNYDFNKHQTENINGKAAMINDYDFKELCEQFFYERGQQTRCFQRGHLDKIKETVKLIPNRTILMKHAYSGKKSCYLWNENFKEGISKQGNPIEYNAFTLKDENIAAQVYKNLQNDDIQEFISRHKSAQCLTLSFFENVFFNLKLLDESKNESKNEKKY